MKRLSLFILTLILAGLLTACATSKFEQPVNIGHIEEALAKEGLKVCASQDITEHQGLEIKGGKLYDLDTDCAQYDPNQPGARVWVIEFNREAARQAALRRFTTESRRSLGLGFAWTHGPFIIAIDGPQSGEVVAAIRQAVMRLGAQ